MANEEKELYKFVNDPKYRSKVIATIHKNSDNAYNKRIKKIEHERDALSKKRTREITRIIGIVTILVNFSNHFASIFRIVHKLI